MTRSLSEIDADLASNFERQAAIAEQARALPPRANKSKLWTSGQRQADNEYRAGAEKLLGEQDALRAERIDAERADLDDRRDHVRAIFERSQSNPRFAGSVERSGEALTTNRQEQRTVTTDYLTTTRAAVENDALRVIERSINSPSAQDRIERLIRDPHDPAAIAARYLAAAGSPEYETAFRTMVRSGPMAVYEMSPQELDAVRSVREAERAMSIGSDSAGGFALPVTLDPTILLASDGSLNPLRSIARVETSVTNIWHGLSSEGLTAGYGYDAEATETSDNSPVLAQPEVICAKGQAFVPFSIELGQDFVTLQAELLKLFQDGRDIVDADAFLTGSGTNEPMGLLTALGVPQNVPGTVDIAGYNALIGALGPRFAPRATAIANRTTLLAARRLSGPGDEDEWPIINESLDRLLGKPVLEMSTMPDDYVAYGDFRQFLIVDRIGATVEIIPWLFGSSHRPTGQRGAYFYWRTGTAVLVPNAFRTLSAAS